jgi:leucyl/phenylalanyl-tRNA---protein transferase
VPIEPAPTEWELPPAEAGGEDDLVALGADLEPGTVLAAYRAGMFPMHVSGRRMLGWWSPARRGVLPLDGLVMSRSLRRSCGRYDLRIDTAFDQVVVACADPSREGAWINAEIRRAYNRLHDMGWAHSVETWDPTTGELVGGLYGVHIDGLFAGESMFHHATDASKVALVGLVDHLRAVGAVLLDVQWLTPHLATLGAIEISRAEYLDRLAAALDTTTTEFALP